MGEMTIGSDTLDEAVGLYQDLPELPDEVAIELALLLLEDVEDLRGGQLQRLEEIVAEKGARHG
jgi:hypothetical protein